MSISAAATGWFAAASSTPTPSPTPSGKGYPDPDTVTPGALAFVIMFLLAIAIWFLLRNLTGRLRRMRYREEQRLRDEQLAAADEEDRRWAEAQAAKAAAKSAAKSKGTTAERTTAERSTSDAGPAAGDAPDDPRGSASSGGTT